MTRSRSARLSSTSTIRSTSVKAPPGQDASVVSRQSKTWSAASASMPAKAAPTIRHTATLGSASRVDSHVESRRSSSGSKPKQVCLCVCVVCVDLCLRFCTCLSIYLCSHVRVSNLVVAHALAEARRVLRSVTEKAKWPCSAIANKPCYISADSNSRASCSCGHVDSFRRRWHPEQQLVQAPWQLCSRQTQQPCESPENCG
jgi:hypothetical protein